MAEVLLMNNGLDGCFTCKEPLKPGEQFASVGDHKFHPNHFTCGTCKKNMSGGGFQFKDDQYFCRECYIDKYCETCRYCQKKITSGGVLPALGGFYHPDCFVCVGCGKGFPDGRFVTKDGKPMHMACAKGSAGAHKCSGCGKPTDVSTEIEVKPGVYYHKDCLNCKHCKEALGTSFQCKGNHLYCRDCYINIFMHRCTACGESITGQMASKPTGETYHPECMKCSVCEEKTALVYRGLFLCQTHVNDDIPLPNCSICAAPIMEAPQVKCALGKNIHIDCFYCELCGVPLTIKGTKMRKDKLCCHVCVMKSPDEDLAPAVSKEAESIRKTHIRQRSRGIAMSKANTFTWTKGELLGKGAFGKVYLGTFPSGTKVAVKTMDPETKEQSADIEREIEVMALLRHPHIVTMLGVQTGRDSSLEIFMEYVQGVELDEEIQAKGLPDDEQMQEWTKQILSALAYCHGKGVMHRDIKGKNILINKQNKMVKLCDFGSAAVLGKDVEKATEDYNYTPLWTAPEILTGEYDRKVDIWSLGCVVIEMASGMPPWSEENFENAFTALYTIGKTKKLPRIPDKISDGARDFILTCLDRNPDTRPDALQLLKHTWFDK